MARNLVLCCDGTANSPARARTNVLKLWLTLERRPEQVVYYDPGVGTLGRPDAATSLGRRLSRAIDMATGTGVRQNVLEAYEFLMDQYEEGDRVFLFGFSRGAYTVRALAGMIDLYGLLPRGSRNFVPYLWQMYSNDERDTSSIGERFKLAGELKRFNRRPAIRLLGVWDTVSSWGWFWNFRSLPQTRKYRSVEHIRHAVAIDERRAAFRQNLFDPEANADLQEVWFPGVHADVGGGYPEEQSGLAKVALEWMLSEAEAQGLLVDSDAKAKQLGRANRTGRTQYAAPDPRAAMHESLRGGWRLLEYVPRRVWIPERGCKRWRCNLGGRRTFRSERCTAVHISVGVRARQGYCPSAVVNGSGARAGCYN